MLLPILIKVIQRFMIPVITRGEQTLDVLHAAIVALTNGTLCKEGTTMANKYL